MKLHPKILAAFLAAVGVLIVTVGNSIVDAYPTETWTPLVATPAFPEYTSGHSSIAGAAATVLADYFGEETPFILESPAVAGWVRYYPSFSTAVDEVADARVFAGIHFRAACVVGTTTGSDVAAYIMENRMGRIHGEGE